MAQPAPEATPEDLERFRIALENEIGRTTLRATARKVRMSPSGLTKFLEGSKPYGRTVARVREWYYSEAGVHRTGAPAGRASADQPGVGRRGGRHLRGA